MSKSVAIIGTRGYPSYYGGFETAVRKIAPYFADLGWKVSVYGRPNSTKENDPELDDRVSRITTWGIEKKSLSTLTYGLTATLHAFWTKPDVALIMNVANGFWLPILKFRGIPTIVNVDGMEWERAKWGRIARKVFYMGAKMTAKFADTLISDSVEIQRRWLEDFGRQSVFIPYGAVVPQNLEIEPGLSHRNYVLAVARFVPENTIPEFFEAVESLVRETTVVVVGSSGYGGIFDEAAKALDAKYENFHWLGHISDDNRLLSLWQHCGVYFHGHSVGGTNPALVQAMAATAPVVARDTPYNREVLGSEGIFVEPVPEEICRELLSIMKSKIIQESNSSLNLRRSIEFYSWDSVLEKYTNSINHAFSNNRQ